MNAVREFPQQATPMTQTEVSIGIVESHGAKIVAAIKEPEKPIVLSTMTEYRLPEALTAFCIALGHESARTATIYYSDPHLKGGDARLQEYIKKLRDANWTVRGEKSQLSTIEQMREDAQAGATGDVRHSYSENARARAISYLRQAEKMGASDLRFNITGKYCNVRVKVLQRSVQLEQISAEDGMDVCRAIYNGLAGQMDETALDERSLQDAAISRTVAHSLDIPPGRIGVHGGDDDTLAMTIRILPRRGKPNKKIGELGYVAEQFAMFDRAGRRRDGLVLLAGKMNAGKSTTLIALVEYVGAAGDMDIVTVEDPVEYSVNLDNVIQLNKIKGWDEELAALKRQSLDIAMPSEIRGSASAVACAEMGMSGLGVWSTLHQDDVFGVPPQLVRWGVDAETVYNSRLINLLVHQALVRTVCPKCSVAASESNLDEGLLKRLARAGLQLTGIRLRGPGCGHCREGEADLVAVADVIRPDAELMRYLRDNGPVKTRHWWLSRRGYSKLKHVASHIRSGRVDPRTAEAMLDCDLDAEVEYGNEP